MTRRHSLITAILPLGCKIPCHSAIIKSIDNGTVLGANAIDTKVLGVIPPEKLSTGTKTLLLMLFMPQNLYHMMDFGKARFTARVINSGQIVHTMDELVLISAKCLREARA